MRAYVKGAFFRTQQAIVLFSFYFYKLFFPYSLQRKWVIAGAETASMLYNLASALPNSISVNFEKNKYYKFEYDYDFSTSNRFKIFNLLLVRPWLLGKLAADHNNFIYLGSSGFCSFYDDGREWEFKFLKCKKKTIVCYYGGSEIRSFKLLNEYAAKNGIDVLTTYQAITNPALASPKAECRRYKLALASDKYADFIFNPPMDQMSYMTSETLPCQYFVDKNLFSLNLGKYVGTFKPVIVHGPSSPLIKGTPLVRAAIKKLQQEGYEFEYRELINVPHQVILDNLKQAHIVLNEFYAFMPGVFTMEALANSCAVLTSADPEIETTLSENVTEAWMVTPYWLVYDHLKKLLDEPSLQKKYAEAGYLWAINNVADDVAYERFAKLISEAR
ncbi:hypothetical protein CWI82_02995 [Pseudidiomarina tainanensis]|uniref:Uncharacterized protein n=1 Tax=Pseudidiomarina tainanensis TaxID=502365 RepID=A0ACD2HI49_9GAMM|nr:glycosyltransferase family 1 protein [Pseudidiomarina tainanensis]RZQ56292.1 hypothetical protein CWI82_02995 [Pseudidiomarina tainanensis]